MDATNRSTALLSDLRENSLPTTISTTFKEILERIQFLSDCLIIDVCDLIRLTTQQPVILHTEAEHKFLIDILDWTQRFQCFARHSIFSTSSAQTAFNTTSSTIEAFKESIKRASILHLVPKITLQKKIFRTAIHSIHRKIRDLFLQLLEPFPVPENFTELQSMINVLHMALSLECPLTHIDGNVIMKNSLFLQQAAGLHQKMVTLLKMQLDMLSD